MLLISLTDFQMLPCDMPHVYFQEMVKLRKNFKKIPCCFVYSLIAFNFGTSFRCSFTSRGLPFPGNRHVANAGKAFPVALVNTPPSLCISSA